MELRLMLQKRIFAMTVLVMELMICGAFGERKVVGFF